MVIEDILLENEKILWQSSEKDYAVTDKRCIIFKNNDINCIDNNNINAVTLKPCENNRADVIIEKPYIMDSDNHLTVSEPFGSFTFSNLTDYAKVYHIIKKIRK